MPDAVPGSYETKEPASKGNPLRAHWGKSPEGLHKHFTVQKPQRLVFSIWRKRTINYIMKCLYCGKDVSLLKRLAKGEFCSDDHRVSYQQEYSQLALNRLLQTYSPEETRKAAQAQADSKVQVTEKTSPKHSSESRTAPVEKNAPDHSAAPPPPARPVPSRPSASARLSSSALTSASELTSKDANSVPTATLEIQPQPAKTIEVAPKSSRKPEPKPMLSELSATPHARVSENHTHAPAPRLTLSLNLASPANATGNASPTANLGRTKKATSAAVAEDGRPEPKRWSSPKTGVAALAQAISHDPAPEKTHEHAQEHPLQTTSLANSTTQVLPLQDVPFVAVTSPEPTHEFRHELTHELSHEIPTEAALPLATAAAPVEPEVQQQPILAENVFILPPAADEPFRLRRASEILISALAPALPRGGIKPSTPMVQLADCLSSSTFVDALKAPWNSRSVRLEFREFARRELVFQFRSTIQGPRLDLATQPAALPFTPVMPRPTPVLWVGPALEFPPIEDQSHATAALHLPLPERPAAITPPAEGRAGSSSTQSESPVIVDASAEPESILTSLPMVFEGIPGGRAKPVQVFASTLRAAAVVDIPRYEALPMRAVIVVERNGAPQAPVANRNGGAEDSIHGWLKSRGDSTFLVESFDGLEEAVGSRMQQKP